jgi:hypothetical protein
MDSNTNQAAGGGVLQASDDLMAAVERFVADEFPIGTRVLGEFDGKLGTVEARHDAEYPLWPVGVRWDDGSYEPCSVTELRVVSTASFDAALGERR